MKQFIPSIFKASPLTVLFFLGVFAISCNEKSSSAKTDTIVEVDISQKSEENNDKEFLAVMQKHLDAVSNRDLGALRETMAPNGQMQLILPGSEIIDGVEGFMNYHKEWFAAPD
ncbi:hypothetical protein [Aequorivita vladivostokensis]|uniref:Nuclear transport factor 2 family protein n=1 Tax=Aequorivita vladivostokensis TaxID=171194 RepID=A0ABR5DL64_9FLAO|nr:hypothetical protein [Aequorivita vladivostokensis]KJJ39513.1 hypothetical protein MB09_04600 [Aequorivita vladivostokensis]